MNKELEFIELEDNESYVILKTIEGTNKYVYLANMKNAGDMAIRKLVLIDNKEILAGLDNDQEFNEAIELFKKNAIN